MSDAGKNPDLAQLRNNLDLLLRAQQYGRTGYVISDHATGRVYWSDSLFEQRRVPPRAYFERDEAMDFIHPEDRAAYVAQRAVAEGDGREFECELRIVRGDGTIIWEKCVNQPQFDASGAYSGLLVTVQDITESKNTTTSLLEQEATYRALFNSIGDAIFLTLGGLFADCNEAALRTFGCSRAQLIGRSPDQFSPPTQPDGRRSEEKAREKIAAALNGEQQRFEWRHRRFDGGEFDAEVVLSRVEGAAQPFFFGVVRDITERKAAELALQSSHDKFAGAFNSSADAMIVLRVGIGVGSGVILDANDAARHIFGRSREAIIGKTVMDSGIVIDTEQMGELRNVLLGGGLVRNYPSTLRRSDGSMIEVKVSGSRFQLGDEVLSLILVRDVTEQNAAERKIQELNASLQASVRQLRAITDNVPVAISYQDVGGRFRFVNRTMESWFAADAASMAGKSVPELVSDKYLAASEPVRQRLRAGEYRSEATLPYPDGRQRTVEVTFVPNRDESGAILGYYTLAIDMTDRKAAEEQLQQSQKMQAIGKLTGGVAHDFNNLLGVISGNLELANDALGAGDAKIAELLEPARRAAERGSTLTRSLLSFARQQPLSPQVTDLNGLARDTTELLRRTLPSNIGLEFVGGAGLWAGEVDPGQLQNALLNLVVNARDAMPDGGRLTVETRNTRIDGDYAAVHADLAPGQYVMLAVSDTGTGMPPDVIARAFEPFFTTKGLGQGTGLGLSMVYGFAKQSSGHVAIYSEVGSGTTVKLYLPRWIGQAEDAAPRLERATPAAQNETVLVVEDDLDMRFVAVTMLRSLGYTVLEAATGAKALDALARHTQTALLVTDVVLAGSMNGRRLAEEATKRHPGIKVLYMSGYTEDAIVHHGRLDHGVHFIQKPFRKQDLASKAREALDAS
ncbi:MAG TPA: PAS domain S-box protein [Rhizomicrobium sp.]